MSGNHVTEVPSEPYRSGSPKLLAMEEAHESPKLRLGWTPAGGTLRKLIEWIVGPRFIDLPIRVIATIDLASAFAPETMESFAPPYLVLHFLAPLLGIAATVFPLTSGIVSAFLFLLQLAVYPEYLDGFQAPMAFSAAVLLTHLRWRSSLFLTAVTFASTWAATVSNAPIEFATPYEILLYEWGRNSVLALAAAALEFRFHQSVEERESSARAHEREIQSERVRFAADAHDTVSQGLARQSRLIALLAGNNCAATRNEIQSELSFTNDETQEQIRSYLSNLQRNDASPDERPAFDPTQAVFAMCESLQRASEAGGIELRLHQSIPPDSISVEAFEQVRLSARELTTNMIKHAAPEVPCRLDLELDQTTRVITLTSSNAVEEAPSAEVRPPRSLAVRAFNLGGSCSVRVQDHIYRVSVVFPL